MKFFSKEETIVLSGILMVVFVVSFFNFQTAIRRARDAQRRDHLAEVIYALGQYATDFGILPPSTSDGKIIACSDSEIGSDLVLGVVSEDEEFDWNEFFSRLRACEWGNDSLRDVTDYNYPVYLKMIPQDPKTDEGVDYVYISNMRNVQMYTYLEGAEDEAGYNPEIVARGIKCGNQICNYGKGSGATPVNMSLEEYDALRAKNY